MGHPSTPLSPSEQHALDQLQLVLEEDEAQPYAAVVEHLTRTGFERPEAPDIVNQLLQKGYLYETDEGLCLT